MMIITRTFVGLHHRVVCRCAAQGRETLQCLLVSGRHCNSSNVTRRLREERVADDCTVDVSGAEYCYKNTICNS